MYYVIKFDLRFIKIKSVFYKNKPILWNILKMCDNVQAPLDFQKLFT